MWSGSACRPAPSRPRVAALDAYKIETYDEGVRLYVEDGAVAIPQILRALDAAEVPLGTIELHRPSLDDVFLTKTGPLLEGELSDEGVPRHLTDLRPADCGYCCATRSGSSSACSSR